MSFSLLAERWIPVRRLHTGRVRIRPAEIASEIDSDPVIGLEWPRPDFRGACLEFLIGLLATACPPRDPRDWLNRYRKPPSAGILDQAFAPISDAFVLDGDGPKFMQDFEPGRQPLASLLIDEPAENAEEDNRDLIVKRGRVKKLCRPAAAMALYTLQTYAPQGGQGNFVSLRGGGPLTTLAIPPLPDPITLWHLVWANVPTCEHLSAPQITSLFPWLPSNSLSNSPSGIETHPAFAFWAMPRRIQLEFSENLENHTCDLLGWTDKKLACGWRQTPHGNKYEAIEHTLSPYYRKTPKTLQWLAVRARPERLGYHNWLGLLFADATKTQKPAECIFEFQTHRLRNIIPSEAAAGWRLLCFGYAMEKAKLLEFVEGEMPVLLPAEPGAASEAARILAELIAGAHEAARLLEFAVRLAIFPKGAKIGKKGSGTLLLSSVRERFWDRTTDDFIRAANAVARGSEPDPIRIEFLRGLAREARRIFNEAAPIEGIGAGQPQRIAGAARTLDFALRGYGKAGAALFTELRLTPDAKSKKRKAA